MDNEYMFGDIVYFTDGWNNPPKAWVGVVTDNKGDGIVWVRWFSSTGRFYSNQSAEIDELTRIGRLPSGTEMDW